MDDQRQRDEEPNHADPRYRIEAQAALLAQPNLDVSTVDPRQPAARASDG